MGKLKIEYSFTKLKMFLVKPEKISKHGLTMRGLQGQGGGRLALDLPRGSSGRHLW